MIWVRVGYNVDGISVGCGFGILIYGYVGVYGGGFGEGKGGEE